MRVAISVRIWKVKLRMEIENDIQRGGWFHLPHSGFRCKDTKKITYDKKNWLLKNKR